MLATHGTTQLTHCLLRFRSISCSRFSTWNYDSSALEGTEAYYATQLYDNGAKCWNGPHRSVKVGPVSSVSLLIPSSL